MSILPERWREIERIFHEAISRPEDARSAYLDESCGNDPDLRREIERLLAESSSDSSLSSPGGDGILDRPAWEAGAAIGDDPPQPAARLGPYVLGERLGAGGMGAVYAAVDSRLGRKVAIKVSREEFSDRFQREAQCIAALNHPNICTVHDVGANYLVMELVAGETLNSRIARGRLSLADVLRYGHQIADALAEAHSQGVVHRDLKPGNIMLSRAGIKVLDFGLARMTDSSGSASLHLTASQTIIGTPAYTAPEQFRGEPAGAAADLFALGLILYQMAAGQLPIPGVSLGSAFANGSRLETPKLLGREFRGLGTLIERLLDPTPERRPPGAAAVRDDLDRLAFPPARSFRKTWAVVTPLVLVGLLIAAGLGWRWWSSRQSDSLSAYVPSQISRLGALVGTKSSVALSPDASKIAFSWRQPNGSVELYSMAVDDPTPKRLVEGGIFDTSPAWSPDGSRIAFYRLGIGKEEGSLMTAPSYGGAAEVIQPVRVHVDLGVLTPLVTWTPDGQSLIFTSMDPDLGRAGLYLTAVRGGPAKRLLPAPENSLGYCRPAISPDGKRLAYALAYQKGKQRLFVRPLSSGWQPGGEETAVSLDGSVGEPLWSRDSQHLFYRQDSAFYRWRAGAEPVRVYLGEGRWYPSGGWTPRGKLRLVVGSADPLELRMCTLRPGGLAIQDQPVPFAPSTASQHMAEFSPDGSQVVFCSYRSGPIEAWVSDASGNQLKQITDLKARNVSYMRWSPDGRRIAFHVYLGPRPQLLIADLSGQNSKPVILTEDSVGYFAPTWSGDGKYLYADRIVTGRIFRIPTSASGAGSGAVAMFEGAAAKVSPDGKRIYYGKLGHAGLFSRSLAGDPSSNPEEKLVDDYMPPGDDINIFPDGVYYVSSASTGKPRMIRFHSFAQRRSVDILATENLPVAMPPGLAVSPDRRKLIYSASTGRGGDLTLVDFE